jgi:hypothetical protein
VVRNIFTEHSEETTLDTADNKHAKWFRHARNTFVVCPHGPARLQQFHHHHQNSVRPTMKFTMEVEANDTLSVLEHFCHEEGSKTGQVSVPKTTHTGHYLHFKPNHPHHVKRGVDHSLISRAKFTSGSGFQQGN